jgi:hypothetical protein
MVVLASDVFVPAFTAIELVPLLITEGSNNIVAIPAIEDILSVISLHTVVAVASVEGIATVSSMETHGVLSLRMGIVVAVASVDDIVTLSSIEIVIGAAKTAYLVIAMLPVQHVGFVGAQEQTTLGAAG